MGHRSKLYISNLLEISQKTIRKAANELKNPDLLTQTKKGK
jgi:DNA-binding GntR family transcriptional regulator